MFPACRQTRLGLSPAEARTGAAPVEVGLDPVRPVAQAHHPLSKNGVNPADVIATAVAAAAAAVPPSRRAHQPPGTADWPRPAARPEQVLEDDAHRDPVSRPAARATRALARHGLTPDHEVSADHAGRAAARRRGNPPRKPPAGRRWRRGRNAVTTHLHPGNRRARRERGATRVVGHAGRTVTSCPPRRAGGPARPSRRPRRCDPARSGAHEENPAHVPTSSRTRAGAGRRPPARARARTVPARRGEPASRLRRRRAVAPQAVREGGGVGGARAMACSIPSQRFGPSMATTGLPCPSAEAMVHLRPRARGVGKQHQRRGGSLGRAPAGITPLKETPAHPAVRGGPPAPRPRAFGTGLADQAHPSVDAAVRSVLTAPATVAARRRRHRSRSPPPRRESRPARPTRGRAAHIGIGATGRRGSQRRARNQRSRSWVATTRPSDAATTATSAARWVAASALRSRRARETGTPPRGRP